MGERLPRMVLDACVIYPSVMREMLVGVARNGSFEPRWSARILEEWARASVKLGPLAEVQARADIALMRAEFAAAEVNAHPGLEARLWLPDVNDIHVLSCAIHGSADGIITLNAKDFPRNILAEEGLTRIDPDGFLMTLWLADAEPVEAAAQTMLRRAETLSAAPQSLRKLLKKAGLPRLGKALGPVFG